MIVLASESVYIYKSLSSPITDICDSDQIDPHNMF